jgi:hypothetical protein
MVQTIAVTEAITNLADAHQQFNLSRNTDPEFFTEWRKPLPELTAAEKTTLDKYRDRYLTYAADGSISEGTVNVIMISPLLELLGLCDPPLRVQGERYIEIAIENDTQILRGRIDVIVVQQSLWIVLIEAKHFGFSVLQGIPQTLAYMMGSPDSQPTMYGLITTGEDFLFLKLQRDATPQYAVSNKFTLLSDEQNNLQRVAQILKKQATLLPRT